MRNQFQYFTQIDNRKIIKYANIQVELIIVLYRKSENDNTQNIQTETAEVMGYGKVLRETSVQRDCNWSGAGFEKRGPESET